MGYHIVYGVDEGDPIDGPHLASGGGWLAWSEWALGFDGYEECHCLAENGRAGELDALADELADLLAEDGDDDLKGITGVLAAALRDKPAAATALVVTDGTEPGDGDDEDDD